METSPYLSEKEVSSLTGFALSTLRNKRFAREGIPYLKIGRAVRYKRQDVIQYMENHRIDFETDPRHISNFANAARHNIEKQHAGVE